MDEGNIEVQQTQILAAIFGAAGCGKLYVMDLFEKQ